MKEIDYDAMLLPKQSWKKGSCTGATKKKKTKLKNGPKHRKVRSIMQDPHDTRCFLCMILDGDYREKETQEHHVIFGFGKRELSNEYGLTVRLCDKHHEHGTEAVHENQSIAELLKKKAQERFMEEYPDLDWMKIIGKNYL